MTWGRQKSWLSSPPLNSSLYLYDLSHPLSFPKHTPTKNIFLSSFSHFSLSLYRIKLNNFLNKTKIVWLTWPNVVILLQLPSLFLTPYLSLQCLLPPPPPILLPHPLLSPPLLLRLPSSSAPAPPVKSSAAAASRNVFWLHISLPLSLLSSPLPIEFLVLAISSSSCKYAHYLFILSTFPLFLITNFLFYFYIFL